MHMNTNTQMNTHVNSDYSKCSSHFTLQQEETRAEETEEEREREGREERRVEGKDKGRASSALERTSYNC